MLTGVSCSGLRVGPLPDFGIRNLLHVMHNRCLGADFRVSTVKV